ncbi:hypothetical protein C8R43DRAFT_1233788 [Mycena crocata]|nr:hypothetical protein C8R43DRAFT_1233788 [Mycena crocata]
MEDLSLELVDRIIDDLSSDLAAVKTCGLVCRRWLPRSRFHLFSEIKLQVGEPSSHMNQPPNTMQSFWELLETSFFDILPCVRHLTLFYDGEYSLKNDDVLRFSLCFQLRSLHIHLPQLLSSDSMEETLWTLQYQLEIVGPKFSSLSEFSLDFFHSSLNALLAILACVPTVEKLRLDGANITEPPDDTNTLPQLPAQLHTLDISVGQLGGEVFFAHLLSLPTQPPIRCLRIDNTSMNLLPGAPTAGYMQRIGHALLSLEISIWGDSGTSSHFSSDLAIYIFIHLSHTGLEQRALQHCTSLRHLCIFSHIWTRSPTYIVDVLSATVSDQLETIRVETANTDVFSAAAVDQALAHPRFRSLRSFSLFGDDESSITDEVHAAMPLASARGILQ